MTTEVPPRHHAANKPLSYGVFPPGLRRVCRPQASPLCGKSAESAGWDGLYLWDHMPTIPGMAVADPFVMAAAIAQATERIRLGMMVTPLAAAGPGCSRAGRDPGTGSLRAGSISGSASGMTGGRSSARSPGEVVDPLERASYLDDSLEILRRLWSGMPVQFEGERIRVTRPPFLPTPFQQPLPIWVAARWPNQRPLAAAATPPGLLPALRFGWARPARATRARAGGCGADQAPRPGGPDRHRHRSSRRVRACRPPRSFCAVRGPRTGGYDMVARIIRPWGTTPRGGRGCRCRRTSPVSVGSAGGVPRGRHQAAERWRRSRTISYQRATAVGKPSVSLGLVLQLTNLEPMTPRSLGPSQQGEVRWRMPAGIGVSEQRLEQGPKA